MRRWRSQLAGVVLLLALSSSGRATQPRDEESIKFDLVPTSALKALGLVDFRLTVTMTSTRWRDSHYDNVTIWAETFGKIKLVGDTKWTCSLDSTLPFSAHVQAEFFPDDTAEIHIILRFPLRPGGEPTGVDRRFFFVTTADSVQIRPGDPRDAPKPWPDWRDQPRGGFPVPGEFPLDDSLWGILKVEPVSLPKHAGPVDLRLSFSPARKPCDSVIFDVRTVGGLVYSGDTVWAVKLMAGIPIDTVISVTVPDKARTAVYVGMQCGGAYHSAERRFFTIHDTLEYYAVHPWHVQDYPPLFVPQKILTGMDRLREMEKTPLVGTGAQFIEVDGVVYTRREGEYKFRVSPPVTDMEAYAKQVEDSMNAIPLTSLYDVKFIICDSTQMALVSSQVADLKPAGEVDSCRVFASRVAKKILMELAEKGVKFQIDVLNPVAPGSSPKETKSESRFDGFDSIPPGPIQKSMASSVVFNENFEGFWPGQWTCHDGNDLIGGIDYWGRSSLMYHSTSKSVWCSGYGDMIDGSHYDIGQSSFLETSVDVHEYGNLSLSFWLWYDILQFGFDNFAYFYSTDDTTWQQLESLNGTGLGWQYKTAIIVNSPERLYLRFVFQSGTTPAPNRGVYLDDIVVTGTRKCDLAPYTPAGWSGPVVLNSHPGVFQSGLLYQGEPIYLHAALVNSGPGTAEAHTEQLHQIEGVATNPWIVPELAPGYYYLQTNIPNTNNAGAGWRQVTYTADLTGVIPEINESNNTWSGWFEWRPPEITIRGYL